MADTVGVHIGASEVTAVRYDASHGDAGVVVPLGESGPGAPAVVVRDDDGAVLVGDAAIRSGATLITDPMARAASGRGGALVALLAHVVGRATTSAGRAPARLAVVVPDEFDAAARDHVVAAGVAAGIADTVVVPLGVARAQPSSPSIEAAAEAAGAARAASLAAAPFVTREDLGAAIVAPTLGGDEEVPREPVSVFEGESGPSPPRQVAADVTALAPAVPPQPPSTPASPERLRYEPPRRRVPLAAWIAAVLLGLIGAVAVAIVLLSGDDPAEVTTDTTSTSAAPASSSTTLPSTSTSAVSSTTSSSTTSTTTTTTTTTTSTTTTPVKVSDPGVVTLVETGLQFDTGTVVRFGQPAAAVLDELTALLGESDDDTGFVDNEFCAGSRSRFVRWGDLEVVLTEEELNTEEGVFTQWYALGSDEPAGLVTRDGLGVGATVGFLEVTYGSALAIVQAIEGEDLGLFAVTNPGSGGILNGITSSLDPEGTVTDLWAGDSCPRVFT